MSVEINVWHRAVLRQRQLVVREMQDELEHLRERYQQERSELTEHYNDKLRRLADPQAPNGFCYDDSEAAHG